MTNLMMLSLADLNAHPDRYTLIDVRDAAEFSARHIPGATNVPLSTLPSVGRVPLGKVPVTVCGKGGGRSTEAAARLRALGLHETLWLEGGTIGWFEANEASRP